MHAGEVRLNRVLSNELRARLLLHLSPWQTEGQSGCANAALFESVAGLLACLPFSAVCQLNRRRKTGK